MLIALATYFANISAGKILKAYSQGQTSLTRTFTSVRIGTALAGNDSWRADWASKLMLVHNCCCGVDEHHVLYVCLVLPKRGGAEFAALSFVEFWFSSSIVGLCLRWVCDLTEWGYGTNL